MAWNDVEVDVEDVLAGGLPVCQKEVHSLAPKRRSSERGRGELPNSEEVCPVVGIKVGEMRGVLARNDEQVAANERLDVHEHDGSVVLVDDARL